MAVADQNSSKRQVYGTAVRDVTENSAHAEKRMQETVFLGEFIESITAFFQNARAELPALRRLIRSKGKHQ